MSSNEDNFESFCQEIQNLQTTIGLRLDNIMIKPERFSVWSLHSTLFLGFLSNLHVNIKLNRTSNNLNVSSAPLVKLKHFY